MDFVCPGCGSELPADTVKCPSCGLELDTVGEPDYECPDCGATVPHDARDCPSCGAQFILDEEEDAASPKAHGVAIDEMLEAAVKETIVTPKRDEAAAPAVAEPPSGAAPTEAGAVGPGTASEWVEDVPAEAAPEGGEAVAGEAPAGAPPAEHLADEDVPEEPAGPATAEAEEAPKAAAGDRPPGQDRPTTAKAPTVPRRYAGGFTSVGMVFVILAGIALVLTIVALRWDAISSGSKYEAIGSMQSLVILLGLAAFVFCAVVSVYDLLRGPKGIDEKPDAPTTTSSR